MNSRHSPGRGAKEEISFLERGMDFRDPKYRREVFLRFYGFHLKYKAHPGAVYYIFPFLAKKYSMTMEQRLWLAFINGCCQHPCSSWVVYKNWPDFHSLNLEKFSLWFRDNYASFGWDTDRRYVKNSFESCVVSYKNLLGGRRQEEFFRDVIGGSFPPQAFEKVWKSVFERIAYFGRLSTFSYLEYLRIMGIPVECNSLFLHDIDGSKSHRNGLCKVLGRDDLDWHESSNPFFDGYSPAILNWLREEGGILLLEAEKRFEGKDFASDVGYFTLESTLCCFKSWFRKNRRYPNVYNDMFHNRIKDSEKRLGKEHFLDFWEARRETLPARLRLEDQPRDPGLSPIKQNHFRETGQVIMMDQEWLCFKNDFNDRYSE